VTGFDDEKEKQQSLTAGFDAFICKPLKLDGLIEVMKHLY
jgi:DNA-binding response OmpR family regulator